MSFHITLPDGRMLGYNSYGDPRGKPLFYFHGWPASRLSAKVYDSLAKKLHIHIIAPDRPGFGISDYQDKRTLLDWPNDIALLANHLKIKKFAVLGVSGGGPYAAVCAYAMPKRITKVGIVVGLGPILRWKSLDGVTFINKIGWANFGNYPMLRRISVLLQYMMAKWSPSLGLHRFLMGAKQDRAMYDNPVIRLRARETQKEAFKSGYRGVEHDLKLYCTDWKFACSDIRVPTYLWYGETDKNVSVNMGKQYAEDIKKSILIVYPGEGHLVSITHGPEILSALTT